MLYDMLSCTFRIYLASGIGCRMTELDIGSVPGLGGRAVDLLTERAHLEEEFALLQRPTTISTYKGKVLSGHIEGDRLGLTRLKRDLGEVAQTLVIGTIEATRSEL